MKALARVFVWLFITVAHFPHYSHANEVSDLNLGKLERKVQISNWHEGLDWVVHHLKYVLAHYRPLPYGVTKIKDTVIHEVPGPKGGLFLLVSAEMYSIPVEMGGKVQAHSWDCGSPANTQGISLDMDTSSSNPKDISSIIKSTSMNICFRENPRARGDLSIVSMAFATSGPKFSKSDEFSQNLVNMFEKQMEPLLDALILVLKEQNH